MTTVDAKIIVDRVSKQFDAGDPERDLALKDVSLTIAQTHRSGLHGAV